MNKFVFLFALVCLLTISCTKEEAAREESQISFSAILSSADGSGTRVSVLGKNDTGTKLNLSWQQTDKIQLYS